MAKRAFMGIVSTLWNFFSMVVLPLALVSSLERGAFFGEVILLPRLDTGMIALLGIIAMALAGLAYAFGGVIDAILTFAKSVVYSYYQWVWIQGMKEILLAEKGVAIAINAEFLILLTIFGTLLSGALSAIHKYLRTKRLEEKTSVAQEELEKPKEQANSD